MPISHSVAQSLTSRRCLDVGTNHRNSRRRPGHLTAAARMSVNAASGDANKAVLILPGFLSASRQYDSLVSDLNASGFHAGVVPMSLSDWAPVVAGSSFDWYLHRLDAALLDLHARHGRVALVGHSAGGWIARILLGDVPYQGMSYGRRSMVHTLVTLGTPHQSIEAYPFGRAKERLYGSHLQHAPARVRESSLQFANHFYPTAASLGGVQVVCACGNAVRGTTLWGSKTSSSSSGGSSSDSYDDASLDSSSSSAGITAWDRYFAYEGYKSGCGRGDVDGDGVTPLCIAQLPGAEELVLPGVWHNPRRKAGQLWYGDAAVRKQWQQFLIDPNQDNSDTKI